VIAFFVKCLGQPASNAAATASNQDCVAFDLHGVLPQNCYARLSAMLVSFPVNLKKGAVFQAALLPK